MTVTIYLDNDTQIALDAFCKAKGLGRGKAIKHLLELSGATFSARLDDQKLRLDLWWNFFMPGIEYGRDDMAFKAFQFGIDDGYAAVRQGVQSGRFQKVNATRFIRPPHLGHDKALQQVAWAVWRVAIGQQHPGDEALIPAKLLVSGVLPEADNPSQSV